MQKDGYRQVNVLVSERQHLWLKRRALKNNSSLVAELRALIAEAAKRKPKPKEAV